MTAETEIGRVKFTYNSKEQEQFLEAAVHWCCAEKQLRRIWQCSQGNTSDVALNLVVKLLF